MRKRSYRSDYVLVSVFVQLIILLNASHSFGVSFSATYSVDYLSIPADTVCNCDSVLYGTLPLLDCPNEPSLPFQTVVLLLESGKEVDYITVTEEVDSLSGKYVVIPGRALPIDSIGTAADTCYSQDSTIYHTDQLWPTNIAEYLRTEIFDGRNSLAFFRIHPVRYNPIDSLLVVETSLSLSVQVKNMSRSQETVQYRHRLTQEDYDSALSSIVDNPDDISSYYAKPTVVDTSLAGIFDNNLPFCDYLIIAKNSVHNVLQPYRDWLNRKGIEAAIAVDSVLYYYSGDVPPHDSLYDNPGKIKAYLRAARANGATFALLVGIGVPNFGNTPGSIGGH